MIRRLLCFLIVAFASFSANAIIITGNFSGYFSRILTPSGDSTLGLGDPVTGSFFVDTSYFSLDSSDSTSAEYFDFNVDPDVPSFSLNFDSSYGTVAENIGAQTIRLQRTGGVDSIYLSDYYPGGYGASLLLVGDSSLFDSLAADAIVAGDIDLADSHAYMGSYLEDKGDAGSFIALDTASLAVADVPEPPTWAIALLALCMTFFMRNGVNWSRESGFPLLRQ